MNNSFKKFAYEREEREREQVELEECEIQERLSLDFVSKIIKTYICSNNGDKELVVSQWLQI